MVIVPWIHDYNERTLYKYTIEQMYMQAINTFMFAVRCSAKIKNQQLSNITTT